KSLGQDAAIEMLHDLKKEGFENTKKMVELYKSENVQGLYDYMKTSSYMTDEVYNEMLTKRNHNWVNEMPEIMQNQSVFFAVGAAHLGGNNGILKLLKDNGYTVKPVKIQSTTYLQQHRTTMPFIFLKELFVLLTNYCLYFPHFWINLWREPCTLV